MSCKVLLFLLMIFVMHVKAHSPLALESLVLVLWLPVQLQRLSGKPCKPCSDVG